MDCNSGAACPAARPGSCLKLWVAWVSASLVWRAETGGGNGRGRGRSPKYTSEPRIAGSTHGASPRAAQYLILAGKARALLKGRFNVSIEDVRALAYPVMRHRILTNFHAESQRITTEEIIRRLLESVPGPKSGLKI